MFASYTQYISLVSLANYFALSPAKCAICEMVTCSYISSVVCENKQLFYFFFCCSTLPSIRNNFLLHPYKNVFYVLFFSHKLTPTSNHALLATIASSISSHFRYTHTQFLTDIDTQTMMLWTTEDIVWRDGRGIDYWGDLWSIFWKNPGSNPCAHDWKILNVQFIYISLSFVYFLYPALCKYWIFLFLFEG